VDDQAVNRLAAVGLFFFYEPEKRNGTGHETGGEPEEKQKTAGQQGGLLLCGSR
jgi:hypothetical protein